MVVLDVMKRGFFPMAIHVKGKLIYYEISNLVGAAVLAGVRQID